MSKGHPLGEALNCSKLLFINILSGATGLAMIFYIVRSVDVCSPQYLLCTKGYPTARYCWTDAGRRATTWQIEEASLRIGSQPWFRFAK